MANERLEDRTLLACIHGSKFGDTNGNGQWDTNLISGDYVVFVIDVSGSVTQPFAGDEVGDVNNDGSANTILDGELAGFLALNQHLVDLGLGDTGHVGIVVFASSATHLDMNPNEDGIQAFASPLADSDGDGTRDVDQVLAAVRTGHEGVGASTNYEAALQESRTILGNAVPVSNIIFLSDGHQNSGGDYSDEAFDLFGRGANLRAFGVGSNASLMDLQVIDPRATIYTTTNDLLDGLSGNGGGGGGGGGNDDSEPGLPNWEIYLDLNNNGKHDDTEPKATTDSDGRYSFCNLSNGTYTVREINQFLWQQTSPAGDNDAHVIDIVNGQDVDGVNFGNREIPSALLYIADSEGILGNVELTTGAVTVIGDMGTILTDIAISRTGEFYGVTSSDLYRINPTNAALTHVGPLGLNGITSLDFGPDDELYAAGLVSTLLYKIDVTDGTATHIGSMRSTVAGDLAWDGNRFFGVTPDNDLLSVQLNPVRGTTLNEIDDMNDVLGLDYGLPGLVGVANTDILHVDRGTGDSTFVLDYFGQGLGPARGAAFGNPVAVQPPVLRGTIRGAVWNDANADGVRDSSERPFGGIEVYLDLNNNGQRDALDPTTFTDLDGRYEFTNLEEGIYTVRQTLSDGDRQTAPQAYVASGFFASAQGQTRIAEINPATGVIIPIGQSPTNTVIHGVALTADSQYIGSNFSTDSFYDIDPQTGLDSIIGSPGLNLSGAMTYVASTDTVYTIGRESSQSTAKLMSVDRASGAVTPIGTGHDGLDNTSAMAWDTINEVFIVFDNFDDEFYEFDLQGTARKLSDLQTPLDAWSLAFNGTEFVMGNLDDPAQIVSIDPQTGVWQEAFRLSEPVHLESLEYVGAGAVAHRISIVGDSVVDDVDFGRVGPVREIVVSETGDTEVSEDGTTDVFTVRLASRPLSDVVIDITTGDATEVEIVTPRITLTPDSWDTGEVVTVRGVDDPDIDGRIGSLITVAVVDGLSDDAFDGQSVLVPVHTLDNDVPQTNTNIRGFIWRDDNRNGVQDNNEPPLTGAQVYLDENNNGHRDPGEHFIPTQELGLYEFTNVTPGPYVVRQILTGPTFQSSPRRYIGIRLTGQGNQTALYHMDEAGNVRHVAIPQDFPIDSVIMTRNSRVFGISHAFNTFHEIDPNTGQSTLIGNLGPRIVTGLSYDPATDSVYAIGRPTEASSVYQLLLVDRRSGTTTPMGTGTTEIQSVDGVAFDFDARRFIVVDNTSDSFYEFDLNGAARKLSDAAAPLNIRSLTYNGTEFIAQLRNPADERQMISIDPDTGQWQNAFLSTSFVGTMALDYVTLGDLGQHVFVQLGQTIADVDFGQFTIAPGFTIMESGNGTLVSEFGISDTLSVMLDRRPDFPVVIRVFSNDATELEIDSATRTLTFTPDDWNIPQTVQLNGVDDDDQDGPQTAQAVFRIDRSLTDDAFDQVADQAVDVTTLDDDTPGITITRTSVTVSESGTTEQFEIFLNSQPDSNVAVDIAIGNPSEVDVTGQFLTFNPFTWNIPQVVTVTGVDDILVDGNQDSILTVGVRDSVSDDEYDPLPDQTVNVRTLDDDTIGLYVDRTHLTVKESGGTDQFHVVLTAAPLSNVVLNVAASDPAEVATDVATLVFTPQNWSVPQRVTVTGRSDHSIDGNQQSVITVTVDPARSDDAYDNVAGRVINVTNEDTNLAAVVASTGTLTVSENGTSATFSVRLTSAPLSNVVVDLASSDTGEVTVSPGRLTFTPANWNLGQTVTVTGVDDEPIDYDQQVTITLAVNAGLSDDSYDSVPDSLVMVTNRENDFAGFTLSSRTALVSESGTHDTVHVVLNTVPSSTVELTVGRQTHGEVVESPLQLRFTPDNWDFPQVITLTGVDDPLDDGDQQTDVQVAINALVSDDAWDELPVQTIVVTTIDDDDADVVPRVTGPTDPQIPGQPVTLEWESVPNALSYEVWLEQIGGTSNPVINPTVARLTHTIQDGLPLGRFRTWVRANLGDNQRTPWTTGEFVVAAAPVIHDLPFHGEDLTPTISWDPIPGATAYRVYINNVTLGHVGLLDTIVSSASVTPNFSFDFGVHRIWVQALGAGNFAGPWSAAESYYLGPDLLTPTLSTFDTQPDFTWTTLTGISTFQLYVQRGSTVVINESGLTDTTWMLPGPLPDGDYRWWIRPFAASGRGGAWSELGEFNIGGRARITAPTGTLNDSIVTINWGQVLGAGSYEIYLFNDSGLGLVHRERDLTGTSFETFPLPDGDYRVWLKTYQTDGTPGPWSRAQSFTVAAASLNLAATPTRPVVPTFDTTPIFRWSADFGATHFDLYLTDGTTVIHETNLTSTLWIPPQALSAQQWRWWVRAKTSSGAGPWSAPATTDLSGRAVLLAPVGTTSDRTPAIVWTNVEGAGRYILQVDNLTTGQSSVIRENSLTSNVFTPATDLAPGSYRGWVLAIEGSTGNAAPWSFFRDFQVTQVEQPPEDNARPTLKSLLAAVDITQAHFTTEVSRAPHGTHRSNAEAHRQQQLVAMTSGADNDQSVTRRDRVTGAPVLDGDRPNVFPSSLATESQRTEAEHLLIDAVLVERFSAPSEKAKTREPAVF